jgi:hypothetical protein
MARNARLSRTATELLAESKTLGYEFAQLCESAEHLRQVTHGGTGVTHNNTVQGFVIAFRNIACFLFPHQTSDFPALRKDDLGAVDYIPDWPTRCPVASRLLCDAKKAADRQVAHMTVARRNLNFVPGNEHFWLFDDIERELLTVLRAFLAAAPRSLLDPTARAGMEALVAPPPSTSSGAITHSGHISVTGVTGSSSPPKPPTSGLCAKTCPD